MTFICSNFISILLSTWTLVLYAALILLMGFVLPHNRCNFMARLKLAHRYIIPCVLYGISCQLWFEFEDVEQFFHVQILLWFWLPFFYRMRKCIIVILSKKVECSQNYWTAVVELLISYYKYIMDMNILY